MNIQPHPETHTFQVYLKDGNFDFMEWKLENPREGIEEAFIMTTFGGKCHLYVRRKWMAVAKAVDDYPFPSDSAAKRYYAIHYQSLKGGSEKPKWIKADFSVSSSTDS